MQKKILVSVWEPLLQQVKQKVEEACLRRDQYLSRVLKHESEMLKQELLHPNSQSTSAFIAKNLATLPRKTVNFLLDADAVDALNESCEARNVPRDAFVNRVLLFLVAGQEFFERSIAIDWQSVYLKMADEGGFHDSGLGMLKGGLSYVAEAVAADPFQFVRRAMVLGDEDGSYSSGLHGVLLMQNALGDFAKTAMGFNCYIPNSWIEGNLTSPHSSDGQARQFSEFLGNSTANSNERRE